MAKNPMDDLGLGLGADSFLSHLPQIMILTENYLPTERDQVMAAFAFMHCSVFNAEGDVEFTANNVPVLRIMRNEIPDDFMEFYSKYRMSGAEGFHARCNASDGNNPLYECALISRNYDIMYKMMCGPDGAALFHPGMVCDEKIYERIRNETMSNIEKLKRGEKLPPVKERANENPIRCYAKRLHKEKLSVNIAKVSENDGREYYCHRPDFRFNCLKSIPCCGHCEMLEKSYHMLIEEALDEKSAADLKEMVERVGLFRKAEDGTTADCYGCKRVNGTCSPEANACRQTIHKLWYMCYRISA